MTPRSTLLELRRAYHESICRKILGLRPNTRGVSVADTDSDCSIDLAGRMSGKMGVPLCRNPPRGQTSGKLFTAFTRDFLELSFAQLVHLRPGNWIYSTSQSKPGIAAFDQYEHLAALQQLLEEKPEFKAALGGDYLITPDIIVGRQPVENEETNSKGKVVSEGERIAGLTPLRAINRAPRISILHASISCKWTMRSDRAQNSRTEALNLIRNRKGHTPHIAVVTMEPLPTRLASIAMGTGDIDCTYHAALHELIDAARESSYKDQAELLDTLVYGRRLRDISDLPFDLAT